MYVFESVEALRSVVLQIAEALCFLIFLLICL